MRKFKLFFAFLLMAVLSIGQVGADPVVLFHETFGAGSTSSQNWSHSNGSQTGNEAVMADNALTSSATNAKQSKQSDANNYADGAGASLMGNQGSNTAEVKAQYIVGPLVTTNCSDMVVSFAVKYGSVGASYYSNLYYSTDNSNWTSVTLTGGPTTANTWGTKASSSTIPASSKIWFKIEYSLGKKGGNPYIDEFDLSGTYSGGPTNPTLSLDPTSKEFNASGNSAQAIALTASNFSSTVNSVTCAFYSESTCDNEISRPSWVNEPTVNDGKTQVSVNVSNNDGDARQTWMKITASDGSKSASAVFAISQKKYVAPTGTFELFSGDLEEGEYVICSGTNAMKNTATSSPRIDAATVTISNDQIENPDENVIWKLEALTGDDDGYWTFSNEVVSKYAAFTNTDGRGNVIATANDYAKWTTEDAGPTYDFTNKGKTGKYLRFNNGYGFASYSTSTGSALTLYKKVDNSKPKTPTFSVAAGAYETAQSVQISCATEGAAIFYTTNGDTPDKNSTPYTGAINVASTTTIKAIAIKDEVSSSVASATYTIIVYQSVDDVWNTITTTGPNNAYVWGYVSQLTSYSNSYYIAVNGFTTSNQLYIYKGDITGVTLEVGDKLKLHGDLKDHQGQKEFSEGATIQEKVAKGALSSVAVDGTPNKTEYAANETFDPTGLKVYGTYANGFVAEITEGITWGNDLAEGKVTGSTTVHVTATVSGITNNPAYDVPVTVAAKTLSSIALSADAFEVYQGQALPKPTVTATYSEGEPADVTTEATFEGYDAAALGAQTITVSYTFGGDTEEETYTVTVKTIENDEAHPYTIAQAIAIVDGGATIAGKTVYIKGFVTAKTNSKITLKDNPSDADLIEMYQYTFDTDVESVVVNDMIIGSGTLSLWNSTKQLASGCKVEWVKPVATIAIANISLEYEEEATLAPTITPAAAASTVSYAITGGDDCITLDNVNKKVTAKSVAGTATITATIAATEDYLGTTKEFTVTVSAPDTRKQAKDEDGFEAVSGNLNDDISYASYKGGGTANPNVKDNAIQLYQISGTNANGGYITFTAVQGCKIDQVKITTAKNATHIAYAADGGDLSATTSNVSAGSIYLTDDNLDAQNVSIYCMHNNSDNRLFVATAVVYYTGTPVAVESVALSGTYPTVFGQGDAFSHEGMTVTATYTNSTSADVTGAAEFTGYDMDVVGPQTVTVSYGGQSTTYDIVVNAATVVDLALSGTYPTRFNVNDAFNHDGMTVTATYSNTSEVDVTADATFSGYNMTTGGIQTVTVEYGGASATYSIIVAPANTDVMVATDLVATNTQYKDFSGVTDLGTDAIYAGTNAKNDAGAIQLRTSDGKSGIVVTTANTGKIVKSVSIAYQTAPTNERKLQVYGKHTAYTSSENLYSNDAAVQGALIGEIAADGSLDCTATEEYEYIGLRSSDGAIYVAVIMIEWADPTPTTYAVTYVSDHGTAPDAENAASVTLAELTEAGWIHTGWVASVDVEVDDATVTAGTPIANGKVVVLSAATEFTAQWTENPAPVYETVRTDLNAGRHYTVCLEKKVTAVKGATFWSLTYKNSENTAAYLVQEEAPFTAGTPYIIQATDDNGGKLEVVYEGDAVGAPVENGALRGTFGNMTASDLNAINVAPNVVYMLFNNELRPIGTDNHLDAHRAYVLYNLLTVPSTSNFAPGKKVKSMPLQKDVATDMDELNASEAPVKVMIDGKFYILRGEKMYDATGKLVK